MIILAKMQRYKKKCEGGWKEGAVATLPAPSREREGQLLEPSFGIFRYFILARLLSKPALLVFSNKHVFLLLRFVFCPDTPEDNILGQKQGDIDCQVFPAEESYDLSAITLTGVDSSNLGYVASSELPDDEEEEFSTAEFLAAIAATNFNESGDVLKAVCETDRVRRVTRVTDLRD